MWPGRPASIQTAHAAVKTTAAQSSGRASFASAAEWDSTGPFTARPIGIRVRLLYGSGILQPGFAVEVVDLAQRWTMTSSSLIPVQIPILPLSG